MAIENQNDTAENDNVLWEVQTLEEVRTVDDCMLDIIHVKIEMRIVSNPINDVNLNVPLVVFNWEVFLDMSTVEVGTVLKILLQVSMVIFVPVSIIEDVVDVDVGAVSNVGLQGSVENEGNVNEENISVNEEEKDLDTVKINDSVNCWER